MEGRENPHRRRRQRLKPHCFCLCYGTVEAVPYKDLVVLAETQLGAGFPTHGQSSWPDRLRVAGNLQMQQPRGIPLQYALAIRGCEVELVEDIVWILDVLGGKKIRTHDDPVDPNQAD